jgi:hypothetical protein
MPTVAPDSITPAQASQRLDRLGFLLADFYPRDAQDAHLIVALHDRPTLQHFDVEKVRFWETGRDHRGHPFELTRGTAMPLRATYSWGKITFLDRHGLDNEFASVGGKVVADEVAPDRTVVVFSSPGPILRLGGQSQPVDSIGSQMGAFFARMMVPIDFVAGAEEAIGAASPLDRYAAFLAYRGQAFRRHPVLRSEYPTQATLVAAEALRLSSSEPESWERGVRLLERIGLRA